LSDRRGCIVNSELYIVRASLIGSEERRLRQVSAQQTSTSSAADEHAASASRKTDSESADAQHYGHPPEGQAALIQLAGHRLLHVVALRRGPQTPSIP
jgi:hypothetical protein